MAWIFVPLQYLFLIWLAEWHCRQATRNAADGAAHSRHLLRGCAAARRVELLQIRFPAVTNRIDYHRATHSVREDISK